MHSYHKQHLWQVCCRCGPRDSRPKPVAKRTPKGPLCYACYMYDRAHDPKKRKPCSQCGHSRTVYRRDDKGQPVCEPCGRPRRKDKRKHRQQVRIQLHRKQPPAIHVQLCVDCARPRPSVIIYSDGQGRCPAHGLTYLQSRRTIVTAALG